MHGVACIWGMTVIVDHVIRPKISSCTRCIRAVSITMFFLPSASYDVLSYPCPAAHMCRLQEEFLRPLLGAAGATAAHDVPDVPPLRGHAVRAGAAHAAEGAWLNTRGRDIHGNGFLLFILLYEILTWFGCCM